MTPWTLPAESPRTEQAAGAGWRKSARGNRREHASDRATVGPGSGITARCNGRRLRAAAERVIVRQTDARTMAKSRIRLRHACRDPRLLALAWGALMGCTTTTSLEPAANSSFEQAVEQLAAHPGASANVTTPVPPLRPIIDQTGPYRIMSHEPGWLTLSDYRTAARVPLTQVQSVSTYDHGRGAIDGALTAGGVGFLLGFGMGFILGSTSSCAADAPCPRPSPVIGGIAGGAVAGALFAAIGAAMGAVRGHETRYDIASP